MAMPPDGTHFLGHVVNHLVVDPRDRRTLIAAANAAALLRGSDVVIDAIDNFTTRYLIN